jgi:hypothetical protein
VQNAIMKTILLLLSLRDRDLFASHPLPTFLGAASGCGANGTFNSGKTSPYATPTGFYRNPDLSVQLARANKSRAHRKPTGQKLERGIATIKKGN